MYPFDESIENNINPTQRKSEVEKLRQFAETMSNILVGHGQATEDEMLAKAANYDKGVKELAQKLRKEADAYYNQWCFCSDHKFQLEAILKRAQYDLLSRKVLEIEGQFDLVFEEEEG